MNASPAKAPARLLALSRPESFAASLRARWVQAGEFRLHYRSAVAADALPEPTPQDLCAVGFVLPKRQCRHAARRNLIRRIARERIRAHMSRQAAQRVACDEPAAGELPVLVLRQQARLGEQWTSAQSPALRRYLHQTLGRLLDEWERVRRGVAAKSS